MKKRLYIILCGYRHTVAGYEVRMRGVNARFAAYGGIGLDRQAYRIMFASGAIAGLIGAIIVLGSHFRFINYALLAPGYGPTGFMAALLAVPGVADRIAEEHAVSGLFTPFLIQSAVQAMTPILLAALAVVLCIRVRIFNLALEGQMSMWIASSTASPPL